MSKVQSVFRFIFGTHGPVSPGYSELFWQWIWILVSFLVLSYASYLYFGSVSDAYFGEDAPIPILDYIKKEGEHHLSGDIPVPSSCHGLTVTPVEVDETHYRLVFTTWQEPSRSCEPLGDTRAFSTIVFAPSTNVNFSAMIDDAELPIRISRRY